MNTLAGERILLASDGEEMVITTHRVLRTTTQWGKAYRISVFLQDVCSFEQRMQTMPLLALLGGACLFTGIYLLGTDPEKTTAWWFFIGALIFCLAYTTTRRHVLSFSGAGSPVVIPIQGMSRERVQEIVETAEMAKHARMLAHSAPGASLPSEAPQRAQVAPA